MSRQQRRVINTNINNKNSLIKIGNLGKSLCKIVQKKKQEIINRKVDLSRLLLIFFTKPIVKNAYNKSTKNFLIKMPETDLDFIEPFGIGSFHRLFLTRFPNIELIEFGLIGTRIKLIATNDKPINSLSLAIIGIRSVIGYNSYLSNMIDEVLNTDDQVLETVEINDTVYLFDLVDEIAKYSGKIKFIDYSNNALDYTYLLDQIDNNIAIYENIEFSIGKREKEITEFDNKTLYLNNSCFNKETVMSAIYYFSLLERNKPTTSKNMLKFLQNRFPKQLKYLDLPALWYFFFDAK